STNDTYMYDTETKNIIHLSKQEDLSDYIEIKDGKYVVKDRYRMLSEADGATTAGATVLGEAITGDRVLTKND
ncbi:hypothetical protein DK853_49000, partial [Klebsiella oxytoca]